MKDGYKNTLFGKLPDKWNISKIKEITVEHKQGYFTKEPYVSDGIYLARVTDLKNPLVDFSEMPKLNISNKDYEDFKICKDDFLFARSGAIGRYGIFENDAKPAIFGSYIIRFRFDLQLVVNRYVGYFYESSICRQQLKSISQGNANVNINAENIKSLNLPIPPLPEQQKIADILTTVDDKLENIESQIAEYIKLKTGLMQQLLTKGIGHTKFVESELGMIPEGWRVTPLSNLTSLMTNGFVGTATTFYTDEEDGIIYIQGYNVEEGRFRLNGIKRVSREFHNKHLKSCLEVGDVLTIQTGEVGVSAVVSKELSGANCHALIISRPIANKLNSYFLSYFLNSQIGKTQIKSIQVGSTMLHINVSHFLKYKIPLPQLPEQVKIVEILSSVDEKIESLQQKKEEFTNLKKGLMEQLLTGRIRVKV